MYTYVAVYVAAPFVLNVIKDLLCFAFWGFTRTSSWLVRCQSLVVIAPATATPGRIIISEKNPSHNPSTPAPGRRRMPQICYNIGFRAPQEEEGLH